MEIKVQLPFMFAVYSMLAGCALARFVLLAFLHNFTCWIPGVGNALRSLSVEDLAGFDLPVG